MNMTLNDVLSHHLRKKVYIKEEVDYDNITPDSHSGPFGRLLHKAVYTLTGGNYMGKDVADDNYQTAQISNFEALQKKTKVENEMHDIDTKINALKNNPASSSEAQEALESLQQRKMHLQQELDSVTNPNTIKKPLFNNAGGGLTDKITNIVKNNPIATAVGTGAAAVGGTLAYKKYVDKKRAT